MFADDFQVRQGMVALAPRGLREIIMRKLTVTAAVAFIAVSFLSVLPWHSAEAPLGSISPHDLTLAAPTLAAGATPDAF
ncbi:MAG TPA: hypothetical protein VFY72_12905 [Beijerinckiaceae bacterium]|nr:hypothetical protein [Beijerinckiaceae bacterium]